MAGHLPASVADAVTATARTAYVHGIHTAALAGAIVLLASAVAVVVGSRRPASGSR